MNSATKFLLLSVLLGNSFLSTSGDLHAQDQFTDPVVLPGLPEIDPVVVDSVPLSPVPHSPQPYAPMPYSPDHYSPDHYSPDHYSPDHYSPVPYSPAPLSPVPLSVPCEHCPLDDAGVNFPHWHRGIPDCSAIISDGAEFDELAADGANRPYQHPAPEVVLRFSRGCTDAEFTNWSLSSRDVPRARPAIPHGPLMIELRSDVEPIAFVELMLDGKPLKPTDYATTSPLSYELPCPSAGQHVLQARYLSGNIWSYYSNALRFEVRLPQQPRIIAASDFDRDPTPLVRNAMTSITTGSIKVHLANVARGDSIVAYVDGKPVSSQPGYETCCRIFKVEGFVTPGVHKLTVRAVGCPGGCSITSRPSNEIAFHYYDEDVYLLRPGAGCCD